MIRHVDEARPVLLALALLPHGTTTSYDPTSSARNAEAPLLPAGELHPPHEVYGTRLLEAASDALAASLAREAADLLDHYRRRGLPAVREETLGALKARIVSDGAGWRPDEVARTMRCLPRLVRVARIESNRHPETGYALPEPAADDRAWALELREHGLSLRQIEQATGLSRSTLARVA